MISQVQINDPKTSTTPWADSVPWVQGTKSLDFGPGLNLIYGPNGSGKSTLLLAMAHLLCCAQGGRQVVTSQVMTDVYPRWDKTKGLLDGILPVHDGQPVMFFDAGHAVGLIGGAFDYDFMEEGIRNTMPAFSSGQRTLQRFDRHLAAALGHIPWPTLEWKVEKQPLLEQFLKGNSDTTSTTPTLILDEPTRSLDILYDRRMWAGLDRIAREKGVQIIATTHSPFALHMKDARYFETSKGYVTDQRLAMLEHVLTHDLSRKTNTWPAATTGNPR